MAWMTTAAAAVPSPVKDVKIVPPIRAKYIYTQMKPIFIFILLVFSMKC